jgi:ribose transport system substrate-binding protein
VKGIVLAPIDNMALRAPVEDAYRNNIPVVIIDSNLNSDKSVSFVATDNYKGGVMAGEHMIKLLSGKGRVAMLRNVEGSASTDNRERGFLDALKNAPEIKVVSSNLYAGATTESAYKQSENLLAPLKTAQGEIGLDGIFCPNESSAFGMLRALQDGGLTGKVKFIGFDSSEKLVEGLEKGHMDALVVQDPVRMGYLGVEKLVDHIHGKNIEKRIDVPATLVTRENLKEKSIKELVAPDIKKWLAE